MSNHFITLAQAIQMTTTYRNNRDQVLNPAHIGKNILPNSETYTRDAFDKLLALPGCVSLRIYHAMDANLQLHSVVVGVDASNRDILPTTDTQADPPPIIDQGAICPPICPSSSPLNP